jgi:hypothetical protein
MTRGRRLQKTTMSIPIGLLAMCGLMVGLLFRCEHNIYPKIDHISRVVWVVMGFMGFFTGEFVSIFFFMNMVTFGWLCFPLCFPLCMY